MEDREHSADENRASAAGRVLVRGLILGGAPFVLLVVAWIIAAAVVGNARQVAFPTPWETVTYLARLAAGSPLLDHSLYTHLGDSLLRWAVGFVFASLCGVAVGLAAGWWRWLEDLVMPIVHLMQMVPGLAWIPVALLVFGVGERTTIFMIAITAFSPIAISVVSGVKGVDETYLRAARMMGAGRGTLFLRVLIPGSLAQLLSGLRIGLGSGWRVLVAAEMVVGTGSGLGYAIVQSRWTLDYAAAFSCMLVICLVGLAVERLLLLPLEKRSVARWGLARAEALR
jgi:ABC-type nitrate/sulfonate/bicarbonate transport system permease component